MTLEEIKAAMRLRWRPGKGYAIAFEVADQSGFGGRRRIDAVVIGLWHSHGLFMHGFEIKRTRADLQRELRDPEKARQSARFCDTYSLVVPADLNIGGLHIPEDWGIYKVKKRRDASKWDAEKRRFVSIEKEDAPLYPFASRKPANKMKDYPRSVYDKEIQRYVRPEMTFNRSAVAAFLTALARSGEEIPAVFEEEEESR